MRVEALRSSVLDLYPSIFDVFPLYCFQRLCELLLLIYNPDWAFLVYITYLYGSRRTCCCTLAERLLQG